MRDHRRQSPRYEIDDVLHALVRLRAHVGHAVRFRAQIDRPGTAGRGFHTLTVTLESTRGNVLNKLVAFCDELRRNNVNTPRKPIRFDVTVLGAACAQAAEVRARLAAYARFVRVEEDADGPDPEGSGPHVLRDPLRTCEAGAANRARSFGWRMEWLVLSVSDGGRYS
jgi:hypothetical protein